VGAVDPDRLHPLLDNGCAHLGEVGARIVAEVFLGIMREDRFSFLRTEPTWQPVLPTAVAADASRWRMADLLAYAVPDDGRQVRIPSPEAGGWMGYFVELETRESETMTSKKSPGVNVVWHGDGWAIRRDGAQRVTKTFDTQKEAIKYGRPVARREETEFRSRKSKGQWWESDPYGHDPAPPIDKEH